MSILNRRNIRSGSSGEKKNPLQRWQKAVSTVLGESSERDILPTDSIIGQIASHFSSSKDLAADQRHKAVLAIAGVGCALSGLIIAVEAYFIYEKLSIIILPILFSLSCCFTLAEFHKTKNEARFCQNGLFLIFVFPQVFHFFFVNTALLNFTRSILSWSSLAPFGALVWFPQSANKWFAAFLTSSCAMLAIESYRGCYHIQSISSLVNSLGLFTLLFLVIRFHVSALNYSKIKLKVANSFLRTHNKELDREKDLMKEEIIKLKKSGSEEEIINTQSKAEKIIGIMQRIKNQDAFKSYVKEIDFVINTLGAGSDLYFPDMTETLARNSHLDNSFKHFLLSHNVKCENHDHSQHDHDHEHDDHDHKHHHPVLGLPSHSADAEKLLESIDKWNFDVFALNEITGQPLYFMGFALFRSHNLIQKFNIDPMKLGIFLQVVEDNYHKENPYHNSTHASDVAQTLHYILTQAGIGKYLTDVDIFAGIVAALIHDVDHPGFNNNFEVTTVSHRALVHNDISVLENHHLSRAFHILNEDSSNIFSGVSSEIKREIRSTIIEMVLATDFSKHLEVLGQYKSRRAAGDFSAGKREDRILLLKMALKCADISHATKSSELHHQWTQRVTDEFYIQGDKERELGMPISPLMDRDAGNVPKSQSGFISFLVAPLFEALAGEFPAANLCTEHMQQNLAHWKKICS